jgi:hypothetical protein
MSPRPSPLVWPPERSMGTHVLDLAKFVLHALRRALDRRNVTEALSAAGELQFRGPSRGARAHPPARWRKGCEVRALPFAGTLACLRNEERRHSRSLAMLALLAAIPSNPLAATALAELLSRRRSCERITEVTSRDGAELGQSWERGEAD